MYINVFYVLPNVKKTADLRGNMRYRATVYNHTFVEKNRTISKNYKVSRESTQRETFFDEIYLIE